AAGGPAPGRADQPSGSRAAAAVPRSGSRPRSDHGRRLARPRAGDGLLRRRGRAQPRPCARPGAGDLHPHRLVAARGLPRRRFAGPPPPPGPSSPGLGRPCRGELMTVHVLVGTSPADAARRAELAALADELDAELAFLQLASPTLGDVLERLARSREAEVGLVGVSGGPGGPGVSWLRRVAADWWRAFGDGAPRVSTAPALMEETSQWRALVELARPITHGGPGLTSAAWEDVPEHRHQVFVCRGPRCTAAGAEPAWKGVVLGLMGAGLGDDDVLVTQT